MINLSKQKITVRCGRRDFLKKYYLLVGGLFPGNLSDKERDIIEAFYLFGGTITTVNRTKVADKLKCTVLNVNNYLDRLRKKGAVLQKEDGSNEFNRILLPMAEQDSVDIPLNFVFKLDEQS